MKTTTYLIYKKQSDGTKQLETATHEEWDAIMKNNKGLPMHQRRCFILDAIVEGDDIDFMYIETTLEEYKKWHSLRVESERKREVKKQYNHISLDAYATTDGTEDLHEALSNKVSMEEIVHDRILLEELRKVLRCWKPCGSDILDVYLSGNRHGSTTWLAKKYSLSEQTIRSYKREFEGIVLKFLLK